MAVTWRPVAYLADVAALGSSTPVAVTGAAGDDGAAAVASREDHIHALGPLGENLGFAGKTAIDFCLENNASDPTTPILGKMYFKTGDLKTYVCTAVA